MRKKLVNDQNQLSIFDIIRQEQELGLTELLPGRLNVDFALNAALKSALKAAPKSREVVADEMTHLLGVKISIETINNWVATSHSHRIPPAYLPAFCLATCSNEPLEVLNSAAGIFTVRGPDALRAEMQKDIEAKKEIEKSIRQKEALIRALDGKP